MTRTVDLFADVVQDNPDSSNHARRSKTDPRSEDNALLPSREGRRALDIANSECLPKGFCGIAGWKKFVCDYPIEPGI